MQKYDNSCNIWKRFDSFLYHSLFSHCFSFFISFESSLQWSWPDFIHRCTFSYSKPFSKGHQSHCSLTTAAETKSKLHHAGSFCLQFERRDGSEESLSISATILHVSCLAYNYTLAARSTSVLLTSHRDSVRETMTYAALDLAAAFSFLLFSISLSPCSCLREDVILMRGKRSKMTAFQLHRLVFTWLHFVHCVRNVSHMGLNPGLKFSVGNGWPNYHSLQWCIWT